MVYLAVNPPFSLQMTALLLGCQANDSGNIKQNRQPIMLIDKKEIENLSELEHLKDFPLTELWLDGNPLCDKYDEFTYAQGVIEMCPKIEKLDGITLRQGGFTAFRRNYLCDTTAVNLVDQFIEHFFTLYDESDRKVLDILYDSKAMFSLVAYYIPGQVSSPIAQLKKYTVISRNLKSMANFSTSSLFLQIGNSRIINILTNLPKTQHDPFTFTVDLVSHNDEFSIFTVSGVFKEPHESLMTPERILSFFRTFVVKAGHNGEYTIINDMLVVTNATSAQQRRAFKVTKIPRAFYDSLPPAQTEQDKNEMAEAFKQITTTNLDWSKKCLRECGYDLKQSLKLFVALYKIDKIPAVVFNDVK